MSCLSSYSYITSHTTLLLDSTFLASAIPFLCLIFPSNITLYSSISLSTSLSFFLSFSLSLPHSLFVSLTLSISTFALPRLVSNFHPPCLPANSFPIPSIFFHSFTSNRTRCPCLSHLPFYPLPCPPFVCLLPITFLFLSVCVCLCLFV